MSKSDKIRFWDKVSFQKDHWFWIGAKSSIGYGCFKLKEKNFCSHRIAYYLINKQRQVSLSHDLDHLCRIKECVNPNHLELVTHTENCMRGLNGIKLKFCKKGLHKLEGWNRSVTKTRENGTQQTRCRSCANTRAIKYYYINKQKKVI